jgi:hypothetical protein
MPIPASKEELTALFRQLGARNPEQWAASQVDEGIPQLLRFLFLKGAWGNIPEEGDSTWIAREIESAKRNPSEPYAGLGRALQECKDKGVPDSALVEISRCLQAQMLFSIGYLMEDPALPEALEDISWGLFQTDEHGRPFGRQVAGLHESVLEFDPSGRELRPRSDA